MLLSLTRAMNHNVLNYVARSFEPHLFVNFLPASQREHLFVKILKTLNIAHHHATRCTVTRPGEGSTMYTPYVFHAKAFALQPSTPAGRKDTRHHEYTMQQRIPRLSPQWV